jgi:hypothetical protein
MLALAESRNWLYIKPEYLPYMTLRLMQVVLAPMLTVTYIMIRTQPAARVLPLAPMAPFTSPPRRNAACVPPVSESRKVAVPCSEPTHPTEEI